MRAERAHSQDGAVAVIVAICLLLLFGAGAIAIDLGSAWETKRDLIVDTDAAALAGAQALATGDCTVAEAVAEDFLEINTGVASIDLVPGSDFECDANAGTVRVDYTGQAQQTLSGAIAASPVQVLSSSTAQTMPGADVGPVRPLVVCDDNPHVAAARTNPSSITNPVTLDGGDLCVEAGGYTGYICFDTNCAAGGKPEDIPNLIRNGWDGEITLGEPPAVDAHDQGCPGNAKDKDKDHDPKWCQQGPGHKTSLTADWGALGCASLTDPDCPVFALVVVDRVDTGRSDPLEPVGFLYVRYYGACEKHHGGGVRPDSALVPAGSGNDCTDNELHLLVDILGYQDYGTPEGQELGEPPRTLLCGTEETDVCVAP